MTALADGEISESCARALCGWTGKLPGQCRDTADEILSGAARKGMDLRDLATLAAGIQSRVRPDPNDDVPAAIRNAVKLRDKFCQWAGGCHQPAAACEVHHLRHKGHGGVTSLENCILLCSLKDPCRRRWPLAGCGRYVTCLLRDVHCAGCCRRSTVSAPVIVIAGAPQVPPVTASFCETLQ
jgi:hypothetical protein